MIGDLNAGNLLIFTLYLFPGYIFLFTFSRHFVPGGRIFGGRTIHLLATLLASIFVFMVFDHAPIRLKIVSFIEGSSFSNDIHFKSFASHLKAEPLFESAMRYLLDSKSTESSTQIRQKKEKLIAKKIADIGKKESDKKYLNHLYYLIEANLFFVTPFSWLLATILGLLRLLTEFLMTLNPVVPFVLLFNWLVWLIDLLGISKLYLFVMKLIKNCVITVLSLVPYSIASFLIKAYFWITQIILVSVASLLIIVVLLVVAGFVLVLLPLEFFLYIYYRILLLFTPPGADLFSTFQRRLLIPILEIKNDTGLILKGRYVGMSPDSSGQLGSLTITNVVQYAPKNKDLPISPGSREVYIFPHFDSKLTIPSSTIKDYNLWYLPSDTFRAYFTVETVDQLERQVWYLLLYLKSHKVFFDFPKEWSIALSAELAPKFFLRVLQILEETYCPPISSIKPFIFKRKLRYLLIKLRPILLKYSSKAKNVAINFPPDRQKRVLEDRRQAVGTFRKLIRKCSS